MEAEHQDLTDNGIEQFVKPIANLSSFDEPKMLYAKHRRDNGGYLFPFVLQRWSSGGGRRPSLRRLARHFFGWSCLTQPSPAHCLIFIRNLCTPNLTPDFVRRRVGFPAMGEALTKTKRTEKATRRSRCKSVPRYSFGGTLGSSNHLAIISLASIRDDENRDLLQGELLALSGPFPALCSPFVFVPLSLSLLLHPLYSLWLSLLCCCIGRFKLLSGLF
ncbi:hypothetical protein C8J56DRAFT_1037668 [Mycena floridula]|nr:hypothetical protein C8J56DRAFT_1037668 [Mycena floridula]